MPNKLKIADEGDIKQLIKANKTDDTKAYKLTKSLGIKYCLDLIQHLTIWIKHFNSHKKKKMIWQIHFYKELIFIQII